MILRNDLSFPFANLYLAFYKNLLLIQNHAVPVEQQRYSYMENEKNGLPQGKRAL